MPQVVRYLLGANDIQPTDAAQTQNLLSAEPHKNNIVNWCRARNTRCIDSHLAQKLVHWHHAVLGPDKGKI